MEQKIKIIKLDNKPTNKKQLYKDILSSSSKVNDLIKKTKRNKFNFKRKKKLIETKEANDVSFTPIIEAKEAKEVSFTPIIEAKEAKEVSFTPIIEAKEAKEVSFTPIIEAKEANDVSFTPLIKIDAKKTKFNKTHFIKYNNSNYPKKSLKKHINSKYKSKKILYKNNSILKYFDSKKKQSINIFSKKEISKFINVMHHYAEYEHYKNIHKYIKKLNKYQTIQILYTLKLIFKKSNAPMTLLKNILYNYFLCNIVIN